MSSARNRRRFAPAGRLILAVAAARKGVVRAFSVGGAGGVSSGVRAGNNGQGKALARASVEQAAEATPPQSPDPAPTSDDMMSFFLLRHGQTNFNAAGRIQGTLDTSVLTKLGIEQAVDAGRTLASRADLNLGPTAIVSSMGRAQQTLACVRDEFRKSGNSKDFEKVEVVHNIREIELHEWQGELIEDIKQRWPEEFAAWKADATSFNIAERYPARDLWARAADAWEEILSLQSIQDQQRTLVVAHNAINQALVWTALGCDVSYFRKLSWPNCAVLELQWRRGKDRAERYRWVIPEPSPFIEAADAARIMKQGKDDTQFTV